MKWLRAIVAFKRKPKPPAYIARKECIRALECYLCPPDICTGMLNPPDEPDMHKPRSLNRGMCVYSVKENGAVMRWNLTLEGANEYYKNQAIKEGASPPVACELTPEAIARLENDEMPEFLRKAP
jgi:hypothetical protein